MYEFLAILVGFLGALMMTMNGELGRHLGSLAGNLAVHLSGLLVIAGLVAASRDWRRLPSGIKPVRLSGGALGFVSVLLVNLSFPALGIALTLGLSLLGQAIASIIVDATGILWAERRRFRPSLLASLGLIALGIGAMSLGSGGLSARASEAIGAGTLALAAGFTTIAGRRVNARLASETTAVTSALWNYAVGSACAALAFGALLAAGAGEGGALGGLLGGAGGALGAAGNGAGGLASGAAGAAAALNAGGSLGAAMLEAAGGAPAWAWLGGAVGVGFVVLSNRVTPRLGAYTMALLVFLGQVGGSVLVEAVLKGRFEAGKLAGGGLILAGLALKGFLENRAPRNGVRPSGSGVRPLEAGVRPSDAGV